MKYYIITRSEMELLVKAGLAVVVCPKTNSGYNWSGVKSITVDGKTYDNELYYKRHGSSGEDHQTALSPTWNPKMEIRLN